MADYTLAFPLIGVNEGGYVFIAGDKGGETYAGITRPNHPNWPGWPTIDAAKPLSRGAIVDGLEPLVETFYKTYYWDPLSLDSINSQRVANFTFDWNVTSGAWAAKKLQAAVGVAADGEIGPMTIAAVNAQDENTLMATLKASRIAFYQNIVNNDTTGTQQKFLQGWIHRVNSFA